MDKQPNWKQAINERLTPNRLSDIVDIVLEGIKVGIYYLWALYMKKIEKQLYNRKGKK
jgi:hypothetical protein